MTGQGTEAEREAAILAIVDEYTYGLADPADITVTTEVYPTFADAEFPSRMSTPTEMANGTRAKPSLK